MLEFNRECFAQLLREVPEKEPLMFESRHSPYIQSLFDVLKEEGTLHLDKIDWSAFEMADVTPGEFQADAYRTSNGWIETMIKRAKKAPAFRSRRRVFF